MKYSPSSQSHHTSQAMGIRSADFNSRLEEGLRRAPLERAKAVKEFWNWIVARV